MQSTFPNRVSLLLTFAHVTGVLQFAIISQFGEIARHITVPERLLKDAYLQLSRPYTINASIHLQARLPHWQSTGNLYGQIYAGRKTR